MGAWRVILQIAVRKYGHIADNLGPIKQAYELLNLLLEASQKYAPHLRSFIIKLPVVPHKAVAEVSKIGNL